jgi:hypothetical protein
MEGDRMTLGLGIGRAKMQCNGVTLTLGLGLELWCLDEIWVRLWVRGLSCLV